MKLCYFALLRDVTHKSEEQWTRPAATLRDLLGDLCAEYGPQFSRWVLRDGLPGSAIVLVDGVDSRGLQGLDTKLRPDSEVLIFPPLAGG